MKPETVAYKRSRFSTRLPLGYRYTASHYWLRESEAGVWQAGFTKFATRMFGDTAHVSLVMLRGSFSLVKLPVKPAGRSCRLK